MYKNSFRDTGQSLDEGDLRDVETEIGYQLPEALREHYRQYNGGTPEKRYFLSEDGTEFELQRFLTMKYPVSKRDLTLENYVKDLVQQRHLVPEGLIPFAIGSGGDPYCIDRNDQSVVFYAMDHSDQPDEATTKVATTLEEFVNGMVTEDQLYNEGDENDGEDSEDDA